MSRKSFLDEEAPPGYIAGLGRGATGFTTQADLGSSNRVGKREDPEKEDGRFEDAERDDEADNIFAAVEQKSKRRRKTKSGDNAKAAEEFQAEETTASENIRKIERQFEDAKKALGGVSADEWLSMPEPGDFTRKTKRRREQMRAQQRFYRNSDTVTMEMKDREGGEDAIDISQVAVARDKVLAGQLTNGETEESVDKEEYLKRLHQEEAFANNIGDYEQTRSLFAKMRRTQPSKAENWIASARLEVGAKKMRRAKELIEEGCTRCPRSEEVWLVSLEIHADDVQECRVIVADALRFHPDSKKLWLSAVEYERDSFSKKRVLMKALEEIPDSPALWMMIADCEEDDSMKVRMLDKATALVPESVELWLKLASLQPLESARITLKKAARKVKEPYKVWLEMARVEESATQNEIKVSRVVEEGFAASGSSLSREQWLAEATKCESDGFEITARAVAMNIMSAYGDKEWDQIASKAADDGHVVVARSIFIFETSGHPQDAGIWEQFIEFESKQSRDTLYAAYEMATQSCPHHVQFYLMYAKEKWGTDNDPDRARQILDEGLKKNSQDEDLWFASAKIEWKTGKVQKAIDLYEKCRQTVSKPSARCYYKQVTLERYLGQNENASDLIEEGLTHYPAEAKLHIQKGQIHESLSQWEEAKSAYREGTSKSPHSPTLWILLSRLYNRHLNKKIKARAVLDEGLVENPKSDMLFVEKMELDKDYASVILSRALQVCPRSPLLWRQTILQAKPQRRKTLYKSALTNTGDSPEIVLTVARDMWSRGKLAQARQFFEACIEANPDYGDAYVYYHAFLGRHGSVNEMVELEKKFKVNDPHHGQFWCETFKDIAQLEEDSLHLLRQASQGTSK